MVLSHRLTVSALLSVIFLFVSVPARFCLSEDSSSRTEGKVIRIGVAVPLNRSRRGVDTNWERSQLVRELKALHKDKHSPVLIEAVPLESSDREDALDEAAKKDCDFVVTTLVIDPFAPGRGGVVVGPGGMQPSPSVIGNSDPRQTLSIQFTVVRLGSGRNFATGVADAPVQDDDTSAATDAMRSVAMKVAHELRKDHGPMSE